ncbi:hypothetical protein EXIGLDRAFT_470627 [Exidia glandulosa HHB12029]|uniref:Uncharacterized protein n=1 Tax=Exidia glandulosa HHB12029 TaxID=1314781 RepID=A0A165JZI6_EXIGL|nr:hypothetical protein EXIGLDRAFT_470627 [Exidia glandulosa HHB12029]
MARPRPVHMLVSISSPSQSNSAAIAHAHTIYSLGESWLPICGILCGARVRQLSPGDCTPFIASEVQKARVLGLRYAGRQEFEHTDSTERRSSLNLVTVPLATSTHLMRTIVQEVFGRPRERSPDMDAVAGERYPSLFHSSDATAFQHHERRGETVAARLLYLLLAL